MALYLDITQVKVYLDGKLYKINVYTEDNNIRALTSDDYILKEANDLYITLKEGD